MKSIDHLSPSVFSSILGTVGKGNRLRLCLILYFKPKYNR